MRLIGTLAEKPWLNPGIDATEAAREQPERYDAAVGLGVFLGVVTILFALITAAYLMRMGAHAAMGHAGNDWYALVEPPLLWINTAILAASSLAFHLAARLAAGKGRGVGSALVAGGGLGLFFLIGQAAVWRQFAEQGYALAIRAPLCTLEADPFALPVAPLASGNPALAFFYLITAVHGLHIIGGLGAWGRAAARLGRGDAAAARTIQLCARYWHFLLLVWLAMFALLLGS